MAMNFNFVLSNNANNGYTTASEAESDSETSLLSNNDFSDASVITATSDYNNTCVDAFGGKDLFGTCDISNMSQGFVAESSSETAGSIAFGSTETMGSMACGSTETAGSVACSSGSSDSGSSCGGGSFSSFC